MNNKRNIAIVLSIVVIVALLVQVARTEDIFTKQTNAGALSINTTAEEIKTFNEEDNNFIDRDNYCIVIDSREKNSDTIKDHIVEVLKLMKKTYTVHDLAEISSIEEYNNYIICVSVLGSITNLDELFEYVNNGKNIFFATRPELDSTFYREYRKLGIIDFAHITDTNGLKLTSNILIKGEGLELGKDFIINSSIISTVDKRCNIHAMSNDNISLLWDVSYGNGKIFFFNGTMLNEKTSRGLISGVLSSLYDDFIYPVMNVKVFFIDDFPAPFPDGTNEEILKKYGRSIKNFFRDVWWTDMIRIQSTYKIKYTGAIIRGYDDLVAPPFLHNEANDSTNLRLYGRELLGLGGELCVHGYNHQSLVVKGDPTEKYSRDELGYNVFNNADAVIKSLQAFNEYFREVYNKYTITCYVPPSNTLGEAARKVIKQGLPQLDTISSLYYSILDEGSYVQEYKIAEDGILEFPRLSYGYFFDDYTKWSIINGINLSGVFSHFVHPDDVLDIERNNNMSWDELAQSFESMNDMVYENYSWLRSMTISQADSEVRKNLTGRIRTEYGKDQISGYINGLSGEYYFILRTNKKPYSEKNCTLEMIDEGVFLVRVTDMSYVIGLR